MVYRQENEMNYKEPSKASNLNMQLEMAKCIIPKRMFDQNPMLKVSMQVKSLLCCVVLTVCVRACECTQVGFVHIPRISIGKKIMFVVATFSPLACKF